MYIYILLGKHDTHKKKLRVKPPEPIEKKDINH